MQNQRLGITSATFAKGPQASRMINAIRAKQVINEHGLDLLDVPQKCLVKEKVQFADCKRKLPWGYHDTWTVVAQAVEGCDLEDITVPEIKQIVTFVENTAFQDFGGADMNMIRDKKTNKITFIDTEDASFYNAGADTKLKLITNLMQRVRSAMTKDAYDWSCKYYEQVNQSENNTPIVPIHRNSQYDNPRIDFETVKQEYKELEGSH
jgi:hypothetical protein